jgi:hypothetical protein
MNCNIDQFGLACLSWSEVRSIKSSACPLPRGRASNRSSSSFRSIRHILSSLLHDLCLLIVQERDRGHKVAMGSQRANEYFHPAYGIDREVMISDICHYLGSDALVRPGNQEVMPNIRTVKPRLTCCRTLLLARSSKGFSSQGIVLSLRLATILHRSITTADQ